MSEVQAVGTPDVRLSISRAAQATGVDFNYLLAQAKLESSLDPNARAGTSSAAGLYQFIGSTWLQTLDRHGANHGLGWADSAIRGGRIDDPAMRAQVMALRYDANASALMAAELAKENQAALRQTLGREPDFAELYLAHFIGSDGASRFLTALQQQPDSAAAAMFPKQAAANRAVFFSASGAPRSFADVMAHFRQRLDQAMSDDGGQSGAVTNFAMTPATRYHATTTSAADIPTGPLAREFQSTAREHAASGSASMVETLRQTFSVAERPAQLPENVKAAYFKLKAFNL